MKSAILQRRLRRAAIAVAVATLLYPASYGLLRATKVLVHQDVWASEIPLDAYPHLANEYPPPPPEEGTAKNLVLDYEWHQIGRGRYQDPPRWGEKPLTHFFFPLSEFELRLRGYGEVEVRVQVLNVDLSESGIYYTPPDFIETRTLARGELWARQDTAKEASC